MALFPRCNNPVPVVGRHGLTLVGCHSCIQCRVAAQEHLCKILEVEASKHKYVEFITNTYDDLHLPYRDWETDRKSTRLNSSHITRSRMPSSA